MSIRAVAQRLIQNGRLLFRIIKPQEPYRTVVDSVTINAHEGKGVGSNLRSSFGRSAFQNVGYQVHYHARRIFVENILNRVTNSLSSDLRKRATKRLFFGDSGPFFALVGVSLASGTGILTKDDELEGICWEIREAVSKLKWATRNNLDEAIKADVSLKDFTLGPAIAKGCSAVCYAAKWKEDPGGQPVMDHGKSAAPESTPSISLNDPVTTFPLAIKMMFNYDAESNALSILRAMHRETVPARYHISSEELSGWEKSFQERTTAIPAHPNVVDMQYVFADQVPQLPGSFSLYPDALPSRINPNGSGRNMSLFLLMKRYDCSLSEYLRDRELTPRVSLILLTQLLEGVAHINMHGVAHRDLKSDNLLIDLSEGEDWPILVVSDFGCCLADSKLGLRLPYHTPDTDKGGNAALMAPEVATAEPGPFTSINYSKSDAWAVGTVAYELFGSINPFYLRADAQHPLLRSSTYKEEGLPTLPSSVPNVIGALIGNLLQRDPSKRMSAEMAANVCQLFLWAPKSWMVENSPSSSEVLQWLLFLTSKLVCETSPSLGSYSQRRTLPEYQLISTFLARVHLRKVRDAVKWMKQYSPTYEIPTSCSYRLKDEDMPPLCDFLATCEVWSLDLCYNRITDNGMIALVKYMKDSLHEFVLLNLMCNDIGSEGIQALCEVGSDLKIKSLRLNGNKIGPEGGKALSNLLGSNDYLKHLDIAETDQNIESMVYIAATLRNPDTKLRSLNLSRPLLKFSEAHAAEVLGQMLSMNINLQELILEKFGLIDQDVELLALGLQKYMNERFVLPAEEPPAVKYKEVKSCSSYETVTSVEEYMKEKGLWKESTDDEASQDKVSEDEKTLEETLEGNDKTLEGHEAGEDDEEVVEYGELIEDKTSFYFYAENYQETCDSFRKDLDFTKNEQNEKQFLKEDEPAESIEQAQSYELKSKDVEESEVTCINPLRRVIANGSFVSYLRHLDLSCNHLSDDSIAYLGPYFLSKPPLLILNLAYNLIGDGGAAELSRYLPSTVIEVLDISHNNIEFYGIQNLIWRLKRPSIMKKLHIWGNQPNKAVCEYLREVLEIGYILQENIDIRIYQVDGIDYPALNQCEDLRSEYYCVRKVPLHVYSQLSPCMQRLQEITGQTMIEG